MNILGISALYHDAAAALVDSDGVQKAAHEERFTRIKHDPRWPMAAIDYCLEGLGGKPDWVAFYDDPVLTYDRVSQTCVEAGERALPLWKRATIKHLTVNSAISKRLADLVGNEDRRVLVQHHHSHAASAFFPSPYPEAAVLVVDAVGEWTTTSIYKGSGNELSLLRRIRFPDSLGILYSAFTQFCGFKVNSGEYKLMGLAPFGQPVYRDHIWDRIITVAPDGAFRLDQRYFDLFSDQRMYTDALADWLGVPPRQPETAFGQAHLDLAASIQAVLNEVMARLARTATELAGSRNLCMAGGVALNCVSNEHLLKANPGLDLWIQPAAGDAGGALGAALYVSHVLHQNPRRHLGRQSDGQRGSLLGPEYSTEAVAEAIERRGLPFKRVDDRPAHLAEIARALHDGKIVGRFKGRMEYGPRALGARSILADASRRDAQSTVNRKIKFREGWRPFAPAVLAEHAAAWFSDGRPSPYMLKTTRLKPERLSSPKAGAAEVLDREGLDLVRTLTDGAAMSEVPAITHVDGSARLQTVDGVADRDFYDQIQAFHELSGIPILLNTSFNVRGEPIVCKPDDAIDCFLDTDMDVLSIEGCIIFKDELPDAIREARGRREFASD